MIKYICHKCDDLSCTTSICPNCGERTELTESAIFWCESLNTPSFYEHAGSEKCRKISSDLRPVFAEERLLIEVLLDEPMVFAGKSMWNTGGSIYIIDGKKKTFSFSEMRVLPKQNFFNI